MNEPLVGSIQILEMKKLTGLQKILIHGLLIWLLSCFGEMGY